MNSALFLGFMASVLFLAYTNGANDNFKGVATLFGSRTADYHRALAWATATTFFGSLSALWISQGLVAAFSGKGLVPTAVTEDPHFLLAVSLGAALTVFLATLTGFPISTTHALTGALVGGGWMAVGPKVNLDVLARTFFLPLAASPLLSLTGSGVLYPLFRIVRQRVGVTKELCLCVGPARERVLLQPGGTAILASTGAALTVGELRHCVEEYRGVLFGIDCQRLLNFCHYLSAGAVSFARGMNDTPKIVALLVAAAAIGSGTTSASSVAAKVLRLDGNVGFILIAAAMAAGGILQARRVARTMSERITRMNHGQGFAANLVTGLLVALASGAGLPVSTTHVSCGSLFGIGLVSGKAHPAVMRNIALSWLITLPVAAFLAAVIFRLI